MSDLTGKWSSREFVTDAVRTECLKHGIDEVPMTEILWNAAEDIVRGRPKFKFLFIRTTLGFGGTQSNVVHMTIISYDEKEAAKKANAMSPSLSGSDSYGFDLIEIQEIG